MGKVGASPNHYETLQVHPAAPLDLITAAYWRLAGEAQTARQRDGAAEIALHRLTCSYQTLATAASRAGYDRSLGIPPQLPAPRLPPRRGPSLLGRLRNIGRLNRRGETAVSYYDILRVDPSAEPAILDEAYFVMRNYYLRLVRVGNEPRHLLDWLEEAHAVTSDPARRAEYDRQHSGRRRRARTTRPSAEVRSATSNTKPTKRKAARQEPKQARTPAARAEAPKEAPERSTRIARPSPSGNGRLNSLAGFIANARRLSGTVATGGGRLAARSYNRLSSLVKRTAPKVGHAVTTGVSGQDREAAAAEEQALLQRLAATPKSPSSSEVAEEKPDVAGLTLIDGPGAGESFPVRRLPLTIGGSDGCDITLPGLPSEQARLLYREGRFVLFCLSDNPAIEVNGEPLAWSVLENGDAFGLGPYRLRFQLPPR